jgi:formamidopyrimidine-DNA glycosylase
MPELPEVETVLRGLQRLALRRRITKVNVLTPWVIGGTPEAFRAQIEARRIVGLERKGKVLILHLGANSARPAVRLVVRLGMTGQIVVAPSDAPLLSHTHVRMALDGGRDELRYRDIRRFGSLRCCSREELSILLRSLGPDALEIHEAQFRQTLRGRRGAIKGLLLNQAFIAGLGNIYADEALFDARIHPETPAGRITNLKARRLLQSIRKVLRRAVELQGTSFRDYIDIEGRPGNFLSRLRVYHRTGEPCLRCGTPLRRITVCGRSSHFCPRCQPRRERRARKLPA